MHYNAVYMHLDSDPVPDSSGSIPAADKLSITFTPSRLVIVPGPERSPEQLTDALEGKLPALYSAAEETPYHGFHHALDMRAAVRELSARAKEIGLEVDDLALDHAALGHDALFALDPQIFGFDSKEGLTAHYIYNLIRELGAPEAHARKVERIILATHVLADPQTVEEKIMRASDLRTIGGSYNDFIEGARRLHQETMTLTGNNVPFEKFVRHSLQVLPLYAWRFLHLTSAAIGDGGVSVWHRNALSNFFQLFSEIEGGRDNIRVVAEVAPGPMDCLGTGRAFKSNEFFVVAEPHGQTLEKTLSIVRATQQRDGGESPVFGVPGNSHALPFFDQSVDELYVHSGDSTTLIEANRVMRGGGMLYAPKSASLDAALLLSFGLVAVSGELPIGKFSVFRKNAH